MGLLQVPLLRSTFGRLPFTLIAQPSTPATGQPSLDPSFKRIMVYVFIASRGGQNRARIAQMLKDEPSNLNRISEKLSLDYKTVAHHVKVLEGNGVIISSSKGTYGAVYFLTPYFEKQYELVKPMWARFGQSVI